MDQETFDKIGLFFFFFFWPLVTVSVGFPTQPTPSVPTRSIQAG